MKRRTLATIRRKKSTASVDCGVDALPYTGFPIKIPTIIAEGGFALDRAGYAAVGLWVLLRGLDSKGSGWAEIDIDRVRVSFATKEGQPRSFSTIRKWLTDGKRLGFFREVIRSGRIAKVWYSSLEDVTALHGVDKKGGIVSWGLTALDLVDNICNYKQTAAKAQVQHLQNVSRRKAKAKSRNKQLCDTEKLLPSCDNVAREPWIEFDDSRTFVPSWFTKFGVSQAKVGRTMGRTKRTIQRRLKDATKQQLAVELNVSNWKNRLSAFELSGKRFQRGRVFIRKGKGYRLYCNIYDLDLEVHLTRSRRRSFNKNLSQVTDKVMKVVNSIIFIKSEREIKKEADKVNPQAVQAAPCTI